MIYKWWAMREYQQALGYDINKMDLNERNEYARQCSLALFMEVSELTDSFQWKPWRPIGTPDKENLKREVIDCLFFLHHIAECFGIDGADLTEKFEEVMQNNYIRLKNGYNIKPKTNEDE